MIRKVVIILLLLLIAPYAGALEPPIGNVPPPEILEEYLPSPQIPVDTAPGGSIGLLKYLPDGSEVEIAGKVVSGVVSPYIPVVFYVQEPDRSAGIRVVVWESVSLSTGEVVDISGILDTMDGERLLRVRANQIAPCSVSTSVEPVLISLASVGGDVAGYQPAVVLRVPTAEEPVGLKAVGVNNVGLLVNIYGKVTAATDDYFYLDDGSDVYVNARDTSHDRMDQHVGSDLWDGTNLGVRVRAVDLWEKPSAGDFVGVVGIVGARLDSENRVLPLLQPRGDADVSEPDTASLVSPSDRIVPEQGGGTRWNLTCLPLPIAFDIAHSSQYPPRAYYFMGEGYLWTYSGPHHAQKQLPVDPEDDLKPISNFTHGAGYWLRLYGSGVSYQAVEDDTTDRWISLPYSWHNLFGHPLNHDVLWGDIKVTDGKRMAGLEEACSPWGTLNWVSSVGIAWDPVGRGSFDIGLEDDAASTDRMQSWHAYHMYAYKPVALIVPGMTYPETARGSIAATVTDTSSYPLVGARVYCKYGSALTTSPNGTALIQGLPLAVSPDPPYLVTASAQGYRSQSKLVYVPEGDPITVDFALESQSGIILWLTANPTVIPPNGTSTSTITVHATDLEGAPLPGEVVDISTDIGTLSVPQITLDDLGIGSAILTSTTFRGIATVTGTYQESSAMVNVFFWEDRAECWPMFAHDQHHTGRALIEDLGGGGSPNVVMYQAWTAEVPTLSNDRPRYAGEEREPIGHRGYYVDHPIFDSSPVVQMWTGSDSQERHTVFVGGFDGTYTSSTGRLYAFNLETGAQLWTYPSSGSLPGGIASTPAVAKVDGEMRVFFGCMDGKVYCLNAETGALCWQYDTEHKVLASPVISFASTGYPNGVLYIGTEWNDLYALNANTGGVIFRTDFDDYLEQDGDDITGVTSAAIVYKDGYDWVLIGSDDGYVYKVCGVDHPTQGSIAASFIDEIYVSPIESSPSYRDGLVYFGRSCEEGGPVYALDIDTFQEVVWHSVGTAEVRTTPALCDEGIYVGDETGSWLYWFTLAQTQYLYSAWMNYVFSSPALAQELVYAGSDAGWLRAYKLTNFALGNKLLDEIGDEFNLGGKISSSVALCYTPEGDTWRRWLLVTSRGPVYDDEDQLVRSNSLLYVFSSHL